MSKEVDCFTTIDFFHFLWYYYSQEGDAVFSYPKMILFDYGHTLLYEPDWNSERGNKELMKYITKNPNNCTLEDIKKGAKLVFDEHIGHIRKMGYDVNGQIGNRVLYDLLGIEFSLTPLEQEIVFWDAASNGAIMPEVDKMLDYINKKGIRSAVISNLLWSGEALTNRLNRLLPNNKFEFVMTSSDYLFRKPNRLLFEIALRKAGLDAENVWYCGDNPQADVEGAAQVGIFPVWYDNETEYHYKDHSQDIPPQCEHLYIQEWDELLQHLETLQI